MPRKRHKFMGNNKDFLSLGVMKTCSILSAVTTQRKAFLNILNTVYLNARVLMICKLHLTKMLLFFKPRQFVSDKLKIPLSRAAVEMTVEKEHRQQRY